MILPVQEGKINFHGYQTWYRRVGQPGGKTPLVCLHGGPGMTHDYLEPLESLAQNEREVIFYDQLGCGNSDHPDDAGLWQIPLYVEELENLRIALDLPEIHLLGQSWGGFLAQEYLLRAQPKGVRSLVLSNSAASSWRWIAEAKRLRSELPAETRLVLDQHEAAGSLDHPAYLEATDVYYRRHLCRLQPWPESLERTLQKLETYPQVYHSMWGENEFTCSGVLKDWDIEARLGEIQLPTLILSGRFDESTPAINELFSRSIPGSRWVLFENSSHTPMLEESQRYLEVLERFLDR